MNSSSFNSYSHGQYPINNRPKFIIKDGDRYSTSKKTMKTSQSHYFNDKRVEASAAIHKSYNSNILSNSVMSEYSSRSKLVSVRNGRINTANSPNSHKSTMSKLTLQ